MTFVIAMQGILNQTRMVAIPLSGEEGPEIRSTVN